MATTIQESLKALCALAQLEINYRRDNDESFEFLEGHVKNVHAHIDSMNDYRGGVVKITDEDMDFAKKCDSKDTVVGKFTNNTAAFGQKRKWMNLGFKARTQKVGPERYHVYAWVR